ncbi:hypothetical protein BKA70DRAFT_1337531 [Coprinopsis sp. MPI-PUGE-AT-0042]|nr:hypothetical protein BKA70DRAFT_1337531 [Coprinopsis sp. MPI-PUGE-AT-0042]
MSSTTLPSSSPGPATSSVATGNSDPRLTAVIAILTIIGIVLIGVIVFITLRLKRRDADRPDRRSMAGPFHGTSIWGREHPALRITPFDAPSNSPSFNHKPGSDMRIAHRRPDGAWHFADSREPFTPIGVSDIENTPVFPFSSHYNSVSSRSNLSLNSPITTKDSEVAATRLAAAQPRRDSSDDWTMSRPLPPPPPAYQRHPRGG